MALISAGGVICVLGATLLVARARPGLLTSRRAAAVRLVAVLAAAGAALAPGQPTGLRPFDVIVRAGLGLGVTLLAARGRRWSWLTGATAVTIAASGSLWAVPGAAALGLAAGAAIAGRRGRVVGALVGALVVQAALRLPLTSPTGLSAGVAAGALVVLALSGLRRAHRRRLILATAGVVAVVAAGAGALAAHAVLGARPAAERGLAEAQAAVTAGEKGDTGGAAADLRAAEADLVLAHARVSVWWAQPARLVPGVAQNLTAVRSLTALGAEVVHPAVALATSSNVHGLLAGGQVDLAAVERLARPVEAGVASLRAAVPVLPRLRSPWLAPAISGRLGSLEAQAARLAGEESRLASAVRTLPALLGANGPRHYLLIVQDTAEMRGSGGLITDWGIMSADRGRLHLDGLQYIGDQPGGASAHPTYQVTGAYARWAAREGFHPEWWPQDATFSPDFPTVARGLEQLFPQLGAPPVDGVVSVDPTALADILGVTGPVRVAGWPVPISAANAGAVFLHDQYVRYRADNPARHDFNVAAGKAIFDRLTSIDLDRPRALVAALAPAVAGRDLLLYSNGTAGQSLFRSMGATGGFSPLSGDWLKVVTDNAGESKIDYFLRRSETYSVDYDPATGHVQATLTVHLHNAAPAAGQPSYVIGGPTQYAANGASLMYVSVYSPLGFTGGTVDGGTMAVSPDRELGRNVYSRFVTVPAGRTSTLVYHLSGAVPGGAVYRLHLGKQATVAPDRVSVAVKASGWRAAGQARTSGARAGPLSLAVFFHAS
ncbi:MAG TPA: DUF4012 domain-containing protein [Acidimicrobiales bacterium]|nr:DUF4012 domain-containing protein [Acidimicrobiales bacterium]